MCKNVIYVGGVGSCDYRSFSNRGGHKFDFDLCGGVGNYVRDVVGGSDVEKCRVAIFFRTPQPINNDWPLKIFFSANRDNFL